MKAGKGSFRRVEVTNIYLFQHTEHVSYSSVTFEQFLSALSSIEYTVCTSCDYNECLELKLSHHPLDPFFYDNVSLRRKWEWEAKHDQVGENDQLLGMLKNLMKDPDNTAAACR